MLRKYLYISICLLLLGKTCFSQALCGFDKLHKQLLASDKSFAQIIEKNEKFIYDHIQSHQINPTISNFNQTAIYKIPVVVHVMHTGDLPGSIYNPSREQILSAIDYLNQVYNGTYPGTQGAGDLQIQFELAKRTPNSTCTDGIDRVNASTLPDYIASGVKRVSNVGCPEITLKNLARWNTDDYYNIWVVNKIDGNDGTFGQYIAGFAYFPGAPTTLDGTVMLATQMIAGEKTLPHEIGHALNLYHTFQGSEQSTNCPSNLFCSLFGDRVCDTDPVTQNVTNGVYNFECRTGINICTGTQYNLNTENNYMAYTTCYTLFTEGQKERLQAAMSLSSRETLVRNDNLALISPNADLLILNQQTSSSTIVSGGSFLVYFSESNEGSLHANPNFVNFHLSQDSILTPGLNGDIYLDQSEINQVIPPLSETNISSKLLTIPAGVTPGSYYLFFAADGSGIVNECIEDNNFATIFLTVSNTPPSSIADYKIWFDNSYNSGIIYNVTETNNYNIQRYVSTNSVTNGLHTVNFQFKKDTLSSSIVSTFFYKSPIVSNTGNGKYEYWADSDYSLRIAKSNPNTTSLIVLDSLDMTSFQEGLHTLNIRFKPTNGLWSSVSSSFFFKVQSPPTGTPKYQYWFDNNWQDTTTVVIPNSNFLVLQDSLINSLQEGLHTFNIRFMINGGLWSSVNSSFFYKTTNLNTGPSVYQYWFDDRNQDSVTSVISNSNNYLLLSSLPTSILSNGLHTLNIRFKIDGKKWSSVNSSFFYKENEIAIPINNLAKHVYWYDNNWQNPKTITIIGTQNISWTLNTNFSELTEGKHNLSMIFKDDYGKWSSIVSDSFTRAPITAQACLNGNRQFISGIIAGANSTYQWQVDDGNGFSNISNNAIYSGTNTDTLWLSNSPTSWYGYRYRCLISNGANTSFGEVYTLKFTTSWIGLANTDWNNPANWSCNSLPDYNTDVYVNANATNYPIVNVNAICRSLNLQPGTTIQVLNGYTINITGK